MAKQEAQRSMFRPITVVTARGVRCSKKRAMTSVIGLDISDVRISKYQLATRRQNPQKWIIKSMKNQRRNSNKVEHTRGRSPIVVVIRSR